MSRQLISRYARLQALVITPIAPHWADYIWLDVLENPHTIQRARWPSDVDAPDVGLTAAREYVKTTSSNITSAEAQAAKRVAKGKGAAFDPKKPKRITIFAASSYPAWQEKYVDLLRELFDTTSLSVDERELKGRVGMMGEVKKAMPFVQGLKSRLVVQKEEPRSVFERKLSFDEVEMLEQMKKGLMKTTGCREVRIVRVEDDESKRRQQELPPMADSALPGSPSFLFENVES